MLYEVPRSQEDIAVNRYIYENILKHIFIVYSLVFCILCVITVRYLQVYVFSYLPRIVSTSKIKLQMLFFCCVPWTAILQQKRNTTLKQFY